MTERDSRIVEFVLGLLQRDAGRAFEREVARSSELRSELTDVADTLDGLADTADDLAPGPGLRATLLRALDPATRFEGFVRRVAALFDLAEDRARELLGELDRVAGSGWEDDRVPRVRLFHLDGGPRVAGADCGLVSVEPGASYPRHHHRGDEWALVLSGRAEEDSGRLWEPGDLIHNPSGSTHAFRALGDEPFVFAVVLHDAIEILTE